jgi:hypothetical protein
VQAGHSQEPFSSSTDQGQLGAFTWAGAAFTAFFGFALAWLVHWTRNGGVSAVGKGRMAVFLAILAAGSLILRASVRRQWLHSLRQETLSRASDLVAQSQQFDHVVSSALSLVQEVELVSRGYKM